MFLLLMMHCWSKRRWLQSFAHCFALLQRVLPFTCHAQRTMHSWLKVLSTQVWASAHGLAELLAKAPELVRGRRVLELGSGCGLAGILAAKLGAAQVCVCQCGLSPLYRSRRALALFRRSSGHDATEVRWPPALMSDAVQVRKPWMLLCAGSSCGPGR